MTDNIVASASARPSRKRFAVDEHTGEWYELRKENRVDHAFAIVSVVYMLLMMAFFYWLLLDIWIGQYSLVNLFRYTNTQQLTSPAFRLPVYAFIGGALGGIVNGIRSFLVWHAERFAFGQRFVWKYIIAPWLGATLALFTYALIGSGVAIIGGDSAPDTATISQVLATFGIGVLAGYGSHNVFVWLDAQVTRIFQVQPTTVIVPALGGKTQQEAEATLQGARLKLGWVHTEDQEDAAQVEKVIRQMPPPGLTVASGESISISVGRLSAAHRNA